MRVCRNLLFGHRAGRITLRVYVRRRGTRRRRGSSIRSSPSTTTVRDGCIEWSVRKAHLYQIAYQGRFLILPWVRVPHLASHLLGRCLGRYRQAELRIHAHPIYPRRCRRGTCYRVAN